MLEVFADMVVKCSLNLLRRRIVMSRVQNVNRRTFIKSVGAGLAVASAPLILPSRLCFGGDDAPSNKLNIALVGCGGRGGNILEEAFQQGANVVALCDVDSSQIEKMRKELSAKVPEMKSCMESARGYGDYRELIEKEKNLDGVLIAIGPWWHASMSSAFMRAGKHVYCEKPLTRLVSEARALGKLARELKVTTQMGTQGAASKSFRRAVEIVQAGLLGNVTEVHAWNVVHQRRPESVNRPAGEDPIPAGFNWDMWVGPSPERPFKANTYLHGCMRTSPWLDFGTGLLGDFGTHTWQLPIRALKLGYPVKVEHNIPEPVKETYVSNAQISYEFPARESMPAVKAWYYDTINRPPQDVVAELEKSFVKFPGVGAMLIGDKGWMHVGGWSSGNYMKLKGEEKFRGVCDHQAAKVLPTTEPRQENQNHMLEWIEAAKAGKKAYQSFEIATHSMEVILPAIVSLRLQRPIDWDGVNMKVPGCPEADQFIRPELRKKWLM